MSGISMNFDGTELQSLQEKEIEKEEQQQQNEVSVITELLHISRCIKVWYARSRSQGHFSHILFLKNCFMDLNKLWYFDIGLLFKNFKLIS